MIWNEIRISVFITIYCYEKTKITLTLRKKGCKALPGFGNTVIAFKTNTRDLDNQKINLADKKI